MLGVVYLLFPAFTHAHFTGSLFEVEQFHESLTWRGDSRLTDYTAARFGIGYSHAYTYSPWSRYLSQEMLFLGAEEETTNTFGFDLGQASGLGVLTSAEQASSLPSEWGALASGGLDAFQRPVQGTNTAVRRSATGLAFGAGFVSATLNGREVPVQFDGRTNNTTGRWRADLEGLSVGQNQLDVVAWHPSGRFYTNATSVFTNNTASDTVTNAYDGNGNITLRVWKNGSGQVRRTQTFSWDAFDQLLTVTLRDHQTNGYDWSAVYDCLGRRLQTTDTVIQSGTNGASSTVIDSTYDPEVEFLEIGVSATGQQHWFVHGPDANGVYGGLQGLGGLEAIVRDADQQLTTVLNDHFGNPVSGVIGISGLFPDTPVGAYGPLAGQPLRLFGLHVEPLDTMLWRGKRIDVTGLYYFGARYYDPTERRFVSADPLGHAATPSLYTAFSGDPVNFFDPDGRLANQLYGDLQREFWRSGAAPYFQDYGFEQSFDAWVEGLFTADMPMMDSYGPPASGSSFGARAGRFAADAILNADLLQQSWQEVRHPDFTSPIGQVTFGVAVVGMLAGTVDAIANVATAGGKGLVQGGVETGIKQIVESGGREAVETAARAEANVTRLGITRNNPADWRATRDLWDQAGYGGILSDANRAAIARGSTPVVDQAWISHFPEDAGLLGQRIPMHHIQGTPVTIPLPAARHLGAHMPGGFRYNLGGPGSALPAYPRTGE